MRVFSINRLLVSGYGGPLIRVKAVSAGEELDIGANANGDLDQDALKSFSMKSNEEIVISRVYDQTNYTKTSGHVGDRFQTIDERMPVIVEYDATTNGRSIVTNPSTGQVAARFDSAIHQFATTGKSASSGGFLPTGTKYDIHLTFRSESPKAIFYAGGVNQYVFKLDKSIADVPLPPEDPNYGDSANLNRVYHRDWNYTAGTYLMSGKPMGAAYTLGSTQEIAFSGLGSGWLSKLSQNLLSVFLHQDTSFDYPSLSVLNQGPNTSFNGYFHFGGYANWTVWVPVASNHNFLGYYEEEVIMIPQDDNPIIDSAKSQEVAQALISR